MLEQLLIFMARTATQPPYFDIYSEPLGIYGQAPEELNGNGQR